MTFNEHTLIALNIALCLQLFGMVFALIIDPYIGKRNKSIMLISAVLVLTLIVQQQAEMYFYKNAMTFPRTIASVYGYSIRPVIICMFMQLFGKIRWPWILIGINAAIYSTAFFSDIAFGYRADQAFVRGPLGFSCHIISAIMLILLVYLTIKNYRSNTNNVSVFPFIIAALIFFGSLSDVFLMTHYIIDTATVVTVSSCLFYYIWLNLRFVSEHESDLKAEQRIKIMMSQIQPHFLFNTLTTIQSLCTSDPELAADTVQKFGVYLRRNIDSLNSDMLITFKKELEYTKVYADIEQIRFPNIRLNYDIQDSDFELPALTVQPMVENAISHGVRIREEGFVSRTQAFSALYEDKEYDRSMQKQFDNVIRNLRDVLKKCGAENIFVPERASMRIRPELIDCDMYRFLDGDMDAINAYRGEYMNQYSWSNLSEAYAARIMSEM